MLGIASKRQFVASSDSRSLMICVFGILRYVFQKNLRPEAEQIRAFAIIDDLIWLLQRCILVERSNLLHYFCQLCVTLYGSVQTEVILLTKRAVFTK